MSINKEYTIDALEIRDTNSHNGSIIYNGDAIIKTIIVENGLNQTVTFQCQASANSDFSNLFNVGSTWDINANTNSYQSCDNYFPYWRIVASCTSSPTTGDLSVIIFGANN